MICRVTPTTYRRQRDLAASRHLAGNVGRAIRLGAALGIGIVLSATTALPTALADVPTRPTHPSQAALDPPALTLTDASLSVEPDADLRLVYALDAATREQLTPPEPAPVDDTSVEQPPDSEQPGSEQPDDVPTAAEENDDEQASGDQNDEDAQEQPDADPPEFVVQITSHTALDPESTIDRSRLPFLIGDDPDPDLFGAAIDGVQLDDARRLLRPGDGTSELALTLPTRTAESAADDLRLPGPGLYPIRVALVLIDPTTGDEQLIASHGTIVERLAAVGARPRPLSISFVGTLESDSRDARSLEPQLERLAAHAAALQTPMLLHVDPNEITESAASRLAGEFVGDEIAPRPVPALDPNSVAAVADDAGFGLRSRYASALLAGETALTERFPDAVVRRDLVMLDAPFSAAGLGLQREFGTRLFLTDDRALEASRARPRDLDPAGTQTAADSPASPVELSDIRRDHTFLAVPPDTARSDDEAGDADESAVAPLRNEVLLVDEAFAASFDSSFDPDDVDADWAVRTIAQLMIARDLRGTGPDQRETIVVRLAGSDATIDSQRLAVLERWSSTTGSIEFRAPSDLPGRTQVQRDPTAASRELSIPTVRRAGVDLEARLGEISVARVALSSATSMLTENSTERRWMRTLDGLLSTDVSDESVRTTIDALGAEAQALRDAVHGPEPFTFTLTGPNGDLDLRLRNDADTALQVLLRITSPKVVVRDAESPDLLVTLEPNSTTDVVVPVRAQANGTSPVVVELFTPSGQALGERTVLTSRVNAFTGLGQVLTGGLLLILGTWWLNHWRANRNARKAADEEAQRTPPGTESPNTESAGTNSAGTNSDGTNPADTNSAVTNPAGTNSAGTGSSSPTELAGSETR